MKVFFCQVMADRHNLNYWEAFELGWSYTISAGLVDSLRTHGAQAHFLDSKCPLDADVFSKGDVLLINDLHHGFTNFGPVGGAPMRLLSEAKSRGARIFGFLNETVFYSEGSAVRDPNWRTRQKIVSQIVPFLDGVITADYEDWVFLRNSTINALYSPFGAPTVSHMGVEQRFDRPIFLGELYESRLEFVRHEGLSDVILTAKLSLDPVSVRGFLESQSVPEFGELPGAEFFAAYKALKLSQYQRYLTTMAASPMVINLPSIFRGIPCRLLEAYSLSGRVLTELPRSPFERELLRKLNKNAAFYDPSIRFDFRRKMDDLRACQPEKVSFSGTCFDIDMRAKFVLAFLDGSSPEKIVSGYL